MGEKDIINREHKIVVPCNSDWENSFNAEDISKLLAISDEEMEEAWAKIEKQRKKKSRSCFWKKRKKERKRKGNIKNGWNWSEIKKRSLKDLRMNYVKKDKEEREMFGYNWEVWHFELPAVWNFEWFKFDYFISNSPVTKEEFERDPLIEKQSYSIKDILKLWKAMKEYMSEYWVIMGSSSVWFYLSEILNLDYSSWVKDKNVIWKDDSRAFWVWHDYDGYFRAEREKPGHRPWLFLKLFE